MGAETSKRDGDGAGSGDEDEDEGGAIAAASRTTRGTKAATTTKTDAKHMGGRRGRGG